MAIRSPSPGAALAIGGTLESDPYRLPTAMTEVVLRELGWNATSLGSQLPTTSLIEAIRDNRPKLFWLSVSYIDSDIAFLRDCEQLRREAELAESAFVVGGRALSGEIRKRMTYSAFCDNLRHLATFASTLGKAAGGSRSGQG